VFSAGNDVGAVDLSSLDFLKESFHMAGSYNWSGVDLTQFPGEFFSLIKSMLYNVVNTRLFICTLSLHIQGC